MPKYLSRSGMVALSMGIALAVLGVSEASAQSKKKMSYDQAFAECKSQVDRTVASDQPTARASAGGACMKKLGFRLKKKSKI